MIFDLILQSHPIVFINYIQFGFQLHKMAEELQKKYKNTTLSSTGLLHSFHELQELCKKEVSVTNSWASDKLLRNQNMSLSSKCLIVNVS